MVQNGPDSRGLRDSLPAQQKRKLRLPLLDQREHLESADENGFHADGNRDKKDPPLGYL